MNCNDWKYILRVWNIPAHFTSNIHDKVNRQISDVAFAFEQPIERIGRELFAECFRDLQHSGYQRERGFSRTSFSVSFFGLGVKNGWTSTSGIILEIFENFESWLFAYHRGRGMCKRYCPPIGFSSTECRSMGLSSRIRKIQCWYSHNCQVANTMGNIKIKK